MDYSGSGGTNYGTSKTLPQGTRDSDILCATEEVTKCTGGCYRLLPGEIWEG